jgi:Fe-S-cluster-containing hydrogenase component 2
MYAARNIDLCSKDCLCLFVCPTGATDTENGQIDKDACLNGCRLCVDACPSHAIYLVYTTFQEPKKKNPELSEKVVALLEHTYQQELMAKALGESSQKPGEQKLARALEKSLRIVAEDCAREAGYMLPQSTQVQILLNLLLANADEEQKILLEKLLSHYS